MTDAAESVESQGELATSTPASDGDAGPPSESAVELLPAADPAFYAARPWLTDRVNSWLAARGESPVLLVSGPAGTGKSRFLYRWAAEVRDSGRLAALISRDALSEPADALCWPVLRDQLLTLDARDGSLSGPSADANKARMDGQAVGELLARCATNPVRELEALVLPMLERLPSGDPLVIAVDGLDEAIRSGRRDFVAVVRALTRHMARAPRRRSGIGRCRLLITARPGTPLGLGADLVPAQLDLGDPDPADREDLRRYVRQLVTGVRLPGRERLVSDICEQAGVAWAAARYLAEEHAPGKQPVSLHQVYAAALERARGRLGQDWKAARSLLALVAAAQDVGAALPKDVAASMLGDDDSDLDSLLAGLDMLVVTGPDGTLRFPHTDIGWWLIDGNAGQASVTDAHDRLAATLMEASGANWRAAPAYCHRYIARHALAAAELSAGQASRFPKLVHRCLALFADQGRLHTDPDPLNWLGELTRLSGLCRADTRLAGSIEPLTGLADRLAAALGSRVALSLALELSGQQSAELEAVAGKGDERLVLAWVRAHVPAYRSLVTDEFVALFALVLGGARLPHDPGATSARRADDYARAWLDTKRSEYLDAAVAAWQDAVAQTDEAEPQRTDRLIELANALIDRVNAGSAEQSEDLDRLLEAQRELADRADLDTQAQAQAYAIYAASLHRRWQSDPSAHAADLDAAVSAWDEALTRTEADDGHRTGRLIGLADALGARINIAEQPDDLDRLLAAWAEVAGRDDLADHVPDPGRSWAVCASWLVRSWKRDPAVRIADLDAAVTAWQMALRRAPHGHPERSTRLIGLADALGDRVRSGPEQSGDMDRLLNTWAEVVGQDDLADPGQCWATYASWLARSWQRDQQGRPGDLDASITAWQVALGHAPGEHPERTSRLAGMANALIARIGTQAEHDDDLDRLLDTQRELTARPDVTNPGQSWAVYAAWLARRWQRESFEPGPDLDAVIDAWQRALDHTPADNRYRSGRLIGLANAIGDRIDSESERPDDLDRLLAAWAEVAERDDLADHVADAGRAWAIYAAWLAQRWQRDRQLHAADLQDSVRAWQRALVGAPDRHPERTRRLAGLATMLVYRAQSGPPEYADLLVDAQAELAARADLAEHVPDVHQFLADRAHWLRRRWLRNRSAQTDDLDAAISAWEQALDGTPDGHPERVRRLTGLAMTLADRVSAGAEQDGDLDRSIGTWAEVLSVAELDDPGEAWAGYAAAQYRRWQRDPAAHRDDLNAAITAWEEALDESPDDHEGRAGWLAGLADALGHRIDSGTGPDGDLDRLLEVQRDLIGRSDLADPGQAWATYATWLDRRRALASPRHQVDVYEATEAWEEALRRTPDGHAERTARLSGLEAALIARIESDAEQDGDLDRLVDVERELVRRPDLASPSEAWAAFASRLFGRWRRDPAARPDDLDNAITAWQECLNSAAAGQPGRVDWLAEAANADLLGSVNETEHADLVRAVTQAREVLKSGEPEACDMLLPALARLASQPA
jgi:AAA ATPase domain